MMKFLNSLSAKITIGIVLITTFVLFFVSTLTISTAQNEFNTATVRIFNGNDIVFVKPLNPPGPLDTIRNEFNERVINAILLAGILGILMSITAGLIFSIIITNPIRKIREGISNLKKSKYKNRLAQVHESEFDELVDEFNDLSSELEYQETLRKDLISDVAHELKTPLTSILGQVQGMEDKVLEVDDKRLSALHRDAERLNQLIELLQEYTHLRSKIPSMNVEEIKVKTLVNELYESFSAKLKENKIKLINNIEDSYKVKADRGMLERILMNIVDNSVKYSKGSEIKIEATREFIKISDNGIGIDDEHLEKIFERFYRIEKSRNRKNGGLGLGLALVKEMVEAHGWEIEAEHNEPKGINFKIKLT